MAARDFYDSELVVATYDLLTEQGNPQINGDRAFYLDCAARHGGPVLELGVGTGRVAWALAEAGYSVVGLDRSAGMLRAAERKGAALPAATRARVQLTQADIADFDLDQRFPLALITFSTFQHLAAAEAQRACLASVHRHLQDGGRLVLDLFDPLLDACVPGAPSPNPDRQAIDPSSGDLLRRRSIRRVNDPSSQSFLETFRLERFDPSGRLLAQADATHHLRWATRQELRYLFELCGFEVEAEFGDFQRGAPAYGRRQIWIVRAL